MPHHSVQAWTSSRPRAPPLAPDPRTGTEGHSRWERVRIPLGWLLQLACAWVCKYMCKWGGRFIIIYCCSAQKKRKWSGEPLRFASTLKQLVLDHNKMSDETRVIVPSARETVGRGVFASIHAECDAKQDRQDFGSSKRHTRSQYNRSVGKQLQEDELWHGTMQWNVQGAKWEVHACFDTLFKMVREDDAVSEFQGTIQ
jgi:hypothetical protein